MNDIDKLLDELAAKPYSKWLQRDKTALSDSVPDLDFVWGYDFEWNDKGFVNFLIELRKMWGLR
jgi:hypothetical protein